MAAVVATPKPSPSRPSERAEDDRMPGERDREERDATTSRSRR